MFLYYESYLILLNLFLSKIDGFNDLARTCSPLELFEMLDLIYKTFDARMDKYDVHKAGSQTYLIIVIFFTLTQFLENKIYTKIYTVNCQFTQ